MTLDAAAAHDALLAEVGAKLALTAETGGARRHRDGRREHGQRRARPRDRMRQDLRRAHADRVRRRRPGARRRVAEKLGIGRVLVPSGAGVGSAIGFLRAPVGYEVVRSLYQRFSTFDVAAVNALLAEMRQEAEAVVAQGSFGAPVDRDAAPRLCAMSARATKSRCRCRRACWRADDVAAIRARYDAGIRAGSTIARCRDRMWRS